MMHWGSLALGLLIGLSLGWVWRPCRRERGTHIGRAHGDVHIHNYDDQEADEDAA